MRKIPPKYENPFDDVLINGCEYVSPIFHSYKFTPNMITTLSNVSAILVIILLLKAKCVIASFFFMISYFFDCLDGHVARKYNQVSVFGDYYDHISDFIKMASILLTMCRKNKNKFFQVLPLIIMTTILSFVHLGYQEKYYNKQDSQSLGLLNFFVPGNANNKKLIGKIMKYTKYFGCGTCNLTLMMSILFYDY